MSSGPIEGGDGEGQILRLNKTNSVRRLRGVVAVSPIERILISALPFNLVLVLLFVISMFFLP